MKRAVIVAVLALVVGVAYVPIAGRPGQPPPTLTTEQRLTIENCLLRIRLVEADLRSLGAELTRTVKAIEATHPGWTLNLGTGQFERPAAVAERKK